MFKVPSLHPFGSFDPHDSDILATDGLASGGAIEYLFVAFYDFFISFDSSAILWITYSPMGCFPMRFPT